jgi:hypothetical protein
MCPVIDGSFSITASVIGTCTVDGITLSQWGMYLLDYNANGSTNFGEEYTSTLVKL